MEVFVKLTEKWYKNKEFRRPAGRERWLSGRKQRTANALRQKCLRGFESHPLRRCYFYNPSGIAKRTLTNIEWDEKGTRAHAGHDEARVPGSEGAPL